MGKQKAGSSHTLYAQLQGTKDPGGGEEGVLGYREHGAQEHPWDLGGDLYTKSVWGWWDGPDIYVKT